MVYRIRRRWLQRFAALNDLPEQAKPSEPLKGFVAATPAADAAMPGGPSLKDELVGAIQVADGFQVEGLEKLLPVLPADCSRFARTLTHGEMKALLTAFAHQHLTASVSRVMEMHAVVAVLFKAKAHGLSRRQPRAGFSVGCVLAATSCGRQTRHAAWAARAWIVSISRRTPCPS